MKSSYRFVRIVTLLGFLQLVYNVNSTQFPVFYNIKTVDGDEGVCPPPNQLNTTISQISEDVRRVIQNAYPSLNADYFIESQQSGELLSLYGANVGVDNNVATYPQGGIGSINNQLWYLLDAGDGYYYIASKANNFVMAMSGISQIRVRVRVDGETTQHWKFCFDGSSDFIFIESRSNPGYVMTVDPGQLLGRTVNWVRPQAQQTTGNDNQQWLLRKY